MNQQKETRMNHAPTFMTPVCRFCRAVGTAPFEVMAQGEATFHA